MKKYFPTSGIFIAAASTCIAFASASLAQEGCVSVAFPAGNDGVVIDGLAPANNTACYRLGTEIGQKITLEVLHGANTVFSVVDVKDAEDHLTFTAQKPSYDINVGQLMRASRPEKFRISIKRGEGDKKSSIDGNSMSYVVNTRSVEDTHADTEVASIALKDVSAATNPDEPAAWDMLMLVLRRLDKVNADTRDQERRCKAHDYRPEDVILIHRCSQIMALKHRRGGFQLRLRRLSKIGCVPLDRTHQFECRFEVIFGANSNLFTDEFSRALSKPVVQKARFIHSADGVWSMI